MNIRTKIYIAAAAAVLFAIGMLGGSTIEWQRTRALDRRIADATRTADELKQKADTSEAEANAYRERTAYLESQIADSRMEAAKQDEQIKNTTNITSGARADAARARGTRSNDATVAGLCRKLASLGHKCAGE